MKLILILLLTVVVSACYGNTKGHNVPVAYDTVYASNTLTVYLIFDTDVLEVDIGNHQYAQQKDKNMALIKAKQVNTSPTSLMIKTQSRVFVWIIAYKDKPSNILIDKRNNTTEASNASQRPSRPTPRSTTGEVSSPVNNERSVTQRGQSLDEYLKRQEERYASKMQPVHIAELTESENRDFSVKDNLMQNRIYHIYDQPKKYEGVGEKRNGLFFALDDIFVDRQFIYIKLSFYNSSSIPYEVDYISTELSAKSEGIKKRKSNSRLPKTPVYRESIFNIFPNLREQIILVYEVFTCNEKDEISIKINEIVGSRSLSLTIPGRYINIAKPL